MDDINEAYVLIENLENKTCISEHIISSLESFLATPLTPIASSWDSFAGEYLSNAVGNGMFYALLAWTGIHTLYTKIINIAMKKSPWSDQRAFEISEALWYIAVHTILFLLSLWMVDPGYVSDILHMDVFSFSWRILLHSVKVVPRKVLFVFVACSTFQIYSALQEILRDENRSAFSKLLTAFTFIIMYCFRKLELLLMANASFCIYRAVSEILKVYHLMTVPVIAREKVTRKPTKKVMKRLSARPLKDITDKYSAQTGENKQQLQTLYNTVKGALILKKSIRRRQEEKKQKMASTSNSEVELSDFSDKLCEINDNTTTVQNSDSTQTFESSQQE